MAPVRTFISFTPPPPILADMQALQLRLREGIRDVSWVRPEQFHSTIVFLGDVEEAVLRPLLEEIASIAQRTTSFEVSYEGLGTFPDRRHPKVLWIGCVPQDEVLPRLKHELDGAVGRRGIALEERAFHPHVTLGRIRTPRAARDLTPKLENLTFEPRRTRIEGISVMKSIVSPQGAQYSVLTTNPLH